MTMSLLHRTNTGGRLWDLDGECPDRGTHANDYEMEGKIYPRDL